jgi:hypothetical protein
MAITIPFVTQFSGKGIQRAIKEFKSLNSNLDRARFLTRKLVLPATIALSAATAVLAKELFDAAKAAAADEAAQKKLEQQLKNTTGATSFGVDMAEAYIAKLQKATGVADDELRPSLGQLATATADLGKAQELLSLALDVSAGSGKSLDEVTTILTQVMAGNFKGLKSLGIAYESTGDRQKDLANVTKLLSDAFGGQAAVAAGTYEGKLRILRTSLGELQESIGYYVLPILTKFVDYVANKIVPGLQVFIDNLGQKGLRGAFINMVAAFQVAGLDLIGVFERIAKGYNKLLLAFVQNTAPLFVVIDGFRAIAALGGDVVTVEQQLINRQQDLETTFTNLRLEVEATVYQMALFAAAAGNVNNNILSAEERMAGFGSKVVAVKPQLDSTDDAVNKLGGSIDKVGQRAEKMAGILRDRMGDALRQAQNDLEAAQQAFDDFKTETADAISGVVNFGDAAAYSAERGGVTFFDALEMQANKAKDFGSLVDRLLAAGLSKDALQQVLDAGVEAGSFIAEQLLESSENILRANKLVEETTKIAQAIGQRASEKFYQAGIANAQAYLKGVEEAIAKAEAMLRKVGLKPADIKGIGAGFDNTMARLAQPIAGTGTMASGIIPSTTSVTVNTVTAPSNLGDTIVAALQDYNRRSGPLQLAIE